MNYLVDTNLLVLLLVGVTRPEAIPHHKRLQEYSTADFELLFSVINNGRPLILTPFVLAELSSLLVQGVSDPLRTELRLSLKSLINGGVERSVSSAVASDRNEYNWLGLTDAALLELCDDEIVLMTADGPLYAAAVAARKLALSFAEIRLER